MIMKLKIGLSLAVVGLMLASIGPANTCANGAQTAREPPIGDLTGRDAVGFRKDKVTKESVGERSVIRGPDVKQTMEDFRQIQDLDYKIRRVSKEAPLALDEVIETANKMNIIANRLKTNLVLPKSKEKTELALADSTEALVRQIGEMDASVRAFVTNPVFTQSANTTRDFPMEASTNLAKVIAISKVVHGGASKLRSGAEQQK